MKKMWYVHTMQYYSGIKKNEILPLATAWMDQETIILSEPNPKDRHRMMSLVCGVSTVVQMNLFTKQKQSY